MTINNKSSWSAVRRYLDSRVGQEWNSIWSDIAGFPDIKEKVERWVEIRCHMDGETVVGEDCEPPYSMYVHPLTGILCKQPPKQRRRAPAQPKIITVGETHYYKFDGIYYRVKFEELPPQLYYNQVFDKNDVFGVWSYAEAWQAYGRHIKMTWKQQANSKECKGLPA